MDPAPPPGAAGRIRHTPPAPAHHAGAGKMTPATRGTGPRAPGGDARGSTGFIADPRPSQVTGGVGESRLGRRDPRDAQAGAAKRRAPVRGKHYRNHPRESQSPTGQLGRDRSRARSRNHRRDRNHSRAPERNHREGEELIVEHGIEITAVERRKKMAKEVGSGGVETKEDERSMKKC